MKKTIIVLVITGALVATLGIAGFAYAQDNQPGTPTAPASPFNGQGFMMHKGRGGQGFLPNAGIGFGRDGILHDYMLPAFGQAFDLSDAELSVLEEAQQIMDNIAENYPPGSEEFITRMKEAVETAVDAALADGAITEEQAQNMLDRLNQSGKPAVGGKGFGRRGMGTPQDGLLADYIEPAIAEAFGLSVDELQARQEAGETLWDIGVEQGLTLEQFQTIMQEAHTNAINNALNDGVITQDQADLMLERLEQGGAFGRGFAPFRP